MTSTLLPNNQADTPTIAPSFWTVHHEPPFPGTAPSTSGPRVLAIALGLGIATALVGLVLAALWGPVLSLASADGHAPFWAMAAGTGVGLVVAGAGLALSAWQRWRGYRTARHAARVQHAAIAQATHQAFLAWNPPTFAPNEGNGKVCVTALWMPTRDGLRLLTLTLSPHHDSGELPPQEMAHIHIPQGGMPDARVLQCTAFGLDRATWSGLQSHLPLLRVSSTPFFYHSAHARLALLGSLRGTYVGHDTPQPPTPSHI